ncbi:OmpA/MotB family protein [Inmirania thermothiophila]|uniref:Flagellar motor protein MotB n=1 Tax=Inmirania thermothiophila TaxID=1750597 RepID=A0A3N1XXX9_9GAMM|nr:flagellar motor protein MotB [Inmirania thermothiophila]ROR29787.1 flagellar motor protein MotB [Inmirania thermothiophila]
MDSAAGAAPVFPDPPARAVEPGVRADDWATDWAVPWSDLMMTMFVLFAALFAAGLTRGEGPRSPGAVEQVAQPRPTPSLEPLTRIDVLERSREAVREARMEEVDVVLTRDNAVRVSVRGPLFFDLGSDALRPEAQAFLRRLAEIIRATPYRVQVIGHTDDYPTRGGRFPTNWELSVLRATRVARFLIEEGGVEPARFTVMGRASYDPVVPNLSDRHRALNRRVDILITRERFVPEAGT